MLTPIKKQGDEHIYILLQINIINWISVRYVDILRFVWMLIGSENRDYTLTRFEKKNRAAEFQSLCFVRMVRVELTQANAHYPLKVACLPFHHIRISCENQVSLSLRDCKYRHCLVNSKIFSRFI